MIPFWIGFVYFWLVVSQRRQQCISLDIDRIFVKSRVKPVPLLILSSNNSPPIFVLALLKRLNTQDNSFGGYLIRSGLRPIERSVGKYLRPEFKSENVHLCTLALHLYYLQFLWLCSVLKARECFFLQSVAWMNKPDNNIYWLIAIVQNSQAEHYGGTWVCISPKTRYSVPPFRSLLSVNKIIMNNDSV